MKSLTKPQWLITAVALAVVIAALAYMLMRGTAVDAVSVKSGPLVQSVVVTGRMATESRVFLGSTVTGRVRAVRYREGASVKAGEIVVQLEDSEQLAAL